MSFQSLDQLTSVESQMSLKFAAITAKVVSDAVRLKMKDDIEGISTVGFDKNQDNPLWLYIGFCLNKHCNEFADNLDNGCSHYPDDVDTIDTMRDQVNQNLNDLGLY